MTTKDLELIWTSTNYCGCCGNHADSHDPDWCTRCIPHITPTPAAPCERTYYAQHKQNCPHQIGGDA